jgi:glycosyltransferase involved in cell wall biosynthesis
MQSTTNPEIVSIVIPAYKGDRFIATALADVAAQSWPHWEVIVVEDGSRGETESIVRSFAASHPSHRVEYIRHEKNLSQSAARNTAIRAARGTHIALLDVDDRWQPSHLASSLAALRESQADLAYSTVATFDDRTDLVIGIWGPSKRDLADFPYSLFRHCFITPTTTVFRRTVIDRIGHFDPEMCPCEDLDYWIRCAAAGIRFTHVKGCHVLYRRNNAQAETGGTCRMTEAFARVIDKNKTALDNPPYEYYRLAARAYFSAAWCHATTNPAQDWTADASRAPLLLRRACEVHRRKMKYWIHLQLLNACERLNSSLLRQVFLRWFRPRSFIRVGQLTSHV